MLSSACNELFSKGVYLKILVFNLHLPHLCVLIILVLSVLLLIQSIVKGMNTLKSIIILSINFIKKDLSF